MNMMMGGGVGRRGFLKKIAALAGASAVSQLPVIDRPPVTPVASRMVDTARAATDEGYARLCHLFIRMDGGSRHVALGHPSSVRAETGGPEVRMVFVTPHYNADVAIVADGVGVMNPDGALLGYAAFASPTQMFEEDSLRITYSLCLGDLLHGKEDMFPCHASPKNP